MPRTIAPSTRREDLPDTATAEELAKYERVDARTFRDDCKAGMVPGAYQRGRCWRIDTYAYFAARDGRG